MPVFRFRDFQVDDAGCGQKVCSDSVLLGAWAFADRDADRDATVLDIGTGSGVLALLCARRFPRAAIIGVELDEGAANAAAINFAASPWHGRMTLLRSDFRNTDVRPDLIICNPPFFDNGPVAPDTARARARHEDGLSYSSLTRYAACVLPPQGRLAFISPPERADDIAVCLAVGRMYVRRRTFVRGSDRKTPNRILWEVSPSEGPTEEGSLCVRRNGVYTPEYLDLVEQYYLFLH